LTNLPLGDVVRPESVVILVVTETSHR